MEPITDFTAEEAEHYKQVIAQMYGRNARDFGDKPLYPPVGFYDSSSGPDRYNNAHQRPLASHIAMLKAHGLRSPYMNADGTYNLDGQVAAYAHNLRRVEDPAYANNRLYRPNTEFGRMANMHDISCWYASDQRDKVLNGIPGFEGRGWESLSKAERDQPNIRGYTPEERKAELAKSGKTRLDETPLEAYERVRYATDMGIYKTARAWEPEGPIGQAYQQRALVGFELLVKGYKTQPATQNADGSYTVNDSYAQKFQNELKAMQQADPNPELDRRVQDIAHRMADKIKAGTAAYGERFDVGSDFERIATLPMSEREQSFFYRKHEDIEALGVPTWIPNPAYPPTHPDAPNHGQFVIKKEIDGYQINMVLDMDKGREFSKTITENGKVLVQETRTPTSPLTPDNMYTPSYEVRTTQHGLDLPAILANRDANPDEWPRPVTEYTERNNEVTQLPAGKTQIPDAQMPDYESFDKYRKALFKEDNALQHSSNEGVKVLRNMIIQDVEQQWMNNALLLGEQKVGQVFEPALAQQVQQTRATQPAQTAQPTLSPSSANAPEPAAELSAWDKVKQASQSGDFNAFFKAMEAHAQTPQAQAHVQNITDKLAEQQEQARQQEYARQQELARQAEQERERQREAELQQQHAPRSRGMSR
ncbi:MAG: hypothetical protein ACRCV6_07160 [Formosimonas sp.]